MRKKLVAGAILLALFGAAVSCLSLAEYFHIQRSGLEEPSFCAINEFINCDTVNASSYASMFGVPTAAWGLMFHIAMLAFLLFVRFSKQPKNSSVTFAWGLALFGFAWSMRMAYISVFVLNALCITCIASYIINTLLLLAVMFAFTLSFKEKVKCAFSKKMIAPVISAAIIFGIGYVFALSATNKGAEQLSSADINMALAAFERQSLYKIEPSDIEDAPLWGNKDAKVTIIEFSDYQCPFCRIAAFNIKPYLNEFKGKIKYVFMNYPLDNSCNVYLQGPMHQAACLAAQFATCAGEQGKFWEMHDAIFRGQRKINDDSLLQMSEELGLDIDKMRTCVDSPETLAKIKKDIEVGHKIYLNGTPSIFVNNRMLRLWRSPEILRAVVKEEIKKIK